MLTEGLLGAFVGAGKGVRDNAQDRIDETIKNMDLLREKNLSRFNDAQRKENINLTGRVASERDDRYADRMDERSKTSDEAMVERDRMNNKAASAEGKANRMSKEKIAGLGLLKGETSTDKKDDGFTKGINQIQKLNEAILKAQTGGDIDPVSGDRIGGATKDQIAPLIAQRDGMERYISANYSNDWARYKGGGTSPPTVPVRPGGPSKDRGLSAAEAISILKEVGGDRDRARQLATERGLTF